MSRVYLYALLGAAPTCPPGSGVCAEPLRLVALGDLLALVGDVEAVPEANAVTLRAQDTLLRRLAVAVDAVLPARFGTLLDDDTALADSLAPRRQALARALVRVAGCEQMTVRVWGEVTPAPVPASGEGGPGTRYLASRRQAAARMRQVPELEPARRRLGDLVRDERAERHDRPPLLATVQHLIPRGAAGRYLEEIDAAREALRPCRVSVTGPWLAYAFSEDTA
jgi:hypothetical protein